MKFWLLTEYMLFGKQVALNERFNGYYDIGIVSVIYHSLLRKYKKVNFICPIPVDCTRACIHSTHQANAEQTYTYKMYSICNYLSIELTSSSDDLIFPLAK